MANIDAILLTPVRLFGEALERCFSADPDVSILGTVSTFSDLRRALTTSAAGVVLVDVTQGVDFAEVSHLAAEFPGVALIALGLQEQATQIIHAGKIGFCGYVARDATISVLFATMRDAVEGRLTCSGELAAQLLRALFDENQASKSGGGADRIQSETLTRRERDVASLVSQGYSNKEIARDLRLSLATVKCHVHHVLEKLQVTRRAQVLTRLNASEYDVHLSANEAIPLPFRIRSGTS